MDGYLYEQVARDLAGAIRRGVYHPGERIPSLRRVAEQYGVSLATAIEAVRTLEDDGLLASRPRSGYYVRKQPRDDTREPPASRPDTVPRAVSVGELALEVLAAARDPALVPLGAAIPGADLLPLKALSRTLAGTARREVAAAGRYESSQGNPELRRQVARRLREAGVRADPDAVVITNGCMEAVTLSLRTVAGPGDVVAIESPSYYGVLQAIEALGMHALEVPTHPRTGIDLDALERLLAGGGIAACLVMPNFNNPFGSAMTTGAKRRLVAITAAAGVPLVEDDIYGDLSHGRPRPPAAKAFDSGGDVLLCSSFSKTLVPGYRIGYAVPGRHLERVRHLKLLGNVATAGIPQLALAGYLKRGSYERTVTRAGRIYRSRTTALREAVLEHFPAGTAVTRPEGGFVLWVELPQGLDALALYRRALAEGIAVTPGVIFVPGGDDRRHLRLSCGQVDEAAGRAAAARLGEIARRVMAGS